MLNELPLLVGSAFGLAAGWTENCAVFLAFLLIHRVFVGLANGITIGAASLYLTEVAPRELRGVIGACHQLFVVIGKQNFQ